MVEHWFGYELGLVLCGDSLRVEYISKDFSWFHYDKNEHIKHLGQPSFSLPLACSDFF